MKVAELRPIVLEDKRCCTLLYGKYGSGKTYTALTLATGLANGKKIAVIDTEGRRTAVYLDRFKFDAFDASYTNDPALYADMIRQLDGQGYGVIILDSISEAWDGDLGGVLWQAAELERKPNKDEVKKTIAGQLKWTEAKKGWHEMLGAMRRTKAAVIMTAKEKEGYDPVSKRNTGEFAPVMEKNTPYMFDVVLHMEENTATIEKMLNPEDTAIGKEIAKPTEKQLVSIYNRALNTVLPEKSVPPLT